MKETKRSGPAIFMYIVIAVTFISSVICFTLYYSGFYKNGIVLSSHVKI